jgi:hypothetical protein
MPKYLSSIFSFRTVQATGRPSRTFIKTIALMIVLVGLAEGASRLMLGSVGHRWEYWDKLAAVKFEDYRTAAASGKAPDVVIIGDSTGARDFDPLSMASSSLEGLDIYNLAWPANFPLALRVTTLPLLDQPYPAPKIVIDSMTPGSFTNNPRVIEFEQDIISSTYCQHVLGKYSLADSLYLPRLRNSAPFLIDRYKPLSEFEQMRKNRGFMPVDTMPEDYQSSNANAPQRLDAERWAVLMDLAQLSKRRNFTLVVVIPPVSSLADSATAVVYDEYLSRLKSAQAQYGFMILDKRHSNFLSAEHFTDGIHLTSAGAVLFSKELAKEFGSL